MQSVSGGLLGALLILLPSMLMGMFLGPAFSNMSRGLEGVPIEYLRQYADEVCRVARGPQSPPPSQKRATSGDDGNEALVLWVIGVVVAVSVYVKYRLPILLVLLTLALAISVVAVLVLAVASRRGVIARSYGRAIAFLAPVIFSAVGIVVVSWMWQPPRGGEVLRRFVDSYRTAGFQLEGFGFVVYQLLGAIFFVSVALGCIMFCVANLCAIYIGVDAWGQTLWRWIYGHIGGAARPRVFWVLGAASLISLLLASGLVFQWLWEQPPLGPS